MRLIDIAPQLASFRARSLHRSCFARRRARESAGRTRRERLVETGELREEARRAVLTAHQGAPDLVALPAPQALASDRGRESCRPRGLDRGRPVVARRVGERPHLDAKRTLELVAALAHLAQTFVEPEP